MINKIIIQHYFRYLRVPALPCGGSSGDSIFSSPGTSGRILNSATSGTPLEISSASSGDEEEKSKFIRMKKKSYRHLKIKLNKRQNL